MLPSHVRPDRLHHHAFVVTDQETTRRFYEDVVGLPLVATWCEQEDFGDRTPNNALRTEAEPS